MPKLTIIVGLPAAGKSTYVKDNFPKLRPENNFDDYHYEAKDGSPFFEKSKHYLPLVRAMIRGEDCVMSDVEWCKKEKRAIVEANLKEIEDVFNVKIEKNFIYFENNPEACKKNVPNRPGRNHQEEIRKITTLTKDYSIPNGMTTIPVRTKDDKANGR